MPYPYSFKIGGEAGFGIMSAGEVLAKIATRSGYFINTYSEYPSLIRGGHNVMQVMLSDQPILAQYRPTHMLVALNQETIDFHQNELVEGSIVVFDAEKGMQPNNLINGVTAINLPFNRLATEAGGSTIMRNTVAVGAVMALLGADLEQLKRILSEQFGKKSPDIVQRNHAAAQVGFDHIVNNYPDSRQSILIPKPVETPLIITTANEAVALGAISAGLQFASIYPMTPTSNILHTLAPHQETHGYIYKQPEDEISAIIMAIGAAHAGARAMVATSGGGFCLMAEGYGLAAITETPIVIIMGMRGGPATGLPTWNGQGDLRFVLHAHQDDFPRIVLSAGDSQEAFDLTMQAFNLADKYQTPVILLVDKHICEGHISLPAFRIDDYVIDRGKFTTTKVDDFHRYALTEDGISTRSVPGSGNHFVANSDEHNQDGYSNEEGQNRIDQMNKRMRKLTACTQQDMPEPKLYGPTDARVTIVSWGSNKGAILEAMKQLPDVNFLYLTWMNPFPSLAVRSILDRANYVINIEANYTAQMRGLIREKTGINILDTFLKYDGRPFYPEEIIEKVHSINK